MCLSLGKVADPPIKFKNPLVYQPIPSEPLKINAILPAEIAWGNFINHTHFTP